MQLSAFNLHVADFPDPGDVLVHNTFSGAYVVLDRETFTALEKHDRGEPLAAHERALIDDPELLEPDIGVLVTSREDEARAYRSWFEAQRSRAELKAIVAVNRACNFDCPYCCQADVMDGAVMPHQVAREAAAWLGARALEIGAERAHITFVGGEPLLHPDRIAALVAELRALVNHRGIDVTMGLITNGYFLDEDMVAALLPHGLTTAQVTLDGDEHTHSRSRVSRRGEDTFARILANVMSASRRIRIVLNGNYQDDTIAGFAPLIRKLAAAGFGREHPISFTPALAFLGAPDGSGSGHCTWSRSAHAYRIALHDELLRHGYSPARLHAMGPCSFHERHMYAVDVDGTLLKCPGFLGHPEWAIGHVAAGLSARYRQMLALDTSATCAGCAHQPNCGGGCIANALLRAGRPDGPPAPWAHDPSPLDVHCEIDYFEEVASHGMTREYLLATSATRDQALAAFSAPPVALPEHAAAVPASSAHHGAPQRARRSPALRIVH